MHDTAKIQARQQAVATTTLLFAKQFSINTFAAKVVPLTALTSPPFRLRRLIPIPTLTPQSHPGAQIKIPYTRCARNQTEEARNQLISAGREVYDPLGKQKQEAATLLRLLGAGVFGISRRPKFILPVCRSWVKFPCWFR